VPSLLLPRSCLPLAYVASIEEVEDGSGPRLFSGNIEVLERDVLENQLPQPTVLIGQSLGDSRLWAVERVQHGIYALCKLCQWVTLNSLGRLQALPWDNGQRQESPHSKIDKYSAEDWWHTAAIRSVFEAEEGMSNAANSKKTCPISLCLQRPVQSVPIKSLRPQGTLSTGAMDAENALDMMVEEVSQMPDEILNMVRYQYQEALYASKVGTLYSISHKLVTNLTKDAVGILCEGPTLSSKSYLSFLRWIFV